MATLAEKARDPAVAGVVRAACSTDACLDVLRLIIKRSGAWSVVWRSDPHLQASAVGMHDLGREILDMIRVADSASYFKILQDEEDDLAQASRPVVPLSDA